MGNFNQHKWPAVLFFLASGLFFFGCVWYLWAGATHPEYHWQSAAATAPEAAVQVLGAKERLLLAKDHGVLIDEERIVYRGRDKGTLHLDLFILQLDPHYGYPYLIPENQAREGFTIGSHQFQVLVASDDKVSLKRL